VEGVILD
jgi:hypothetical protein